MLHLAAISMIKYKSSDSFLSHSTMLCHNLDSGFTWLLSHKQTLNFKNRSNVATIRSTSSGFTRINPTGEKSLNHDRLDYLRINISYFNYTKNTNNNWAVILAVKHSDPPLPLSFHHNYQEHLIREVQSQKAIKQVKWLNKNNQTDNRELCVSSLV